MAHAKEGSGRTPLSFGTRHGPFETADGTILRHRSNAAVTSALRTLDAEAGGIAAIAAALQGPLGAAFAAAVELIRQAKGRVIVTGLGKSGHVARKIAATLASTGTPAFFVHAAEASHGDLGMITPDDVIIALSWSGEQPEMKNLVNYSSRFAIPLIAMTSQRRLLARRGRRHRAGAAESARGLSAQSGADHLVADAGCDRRRAGHRAARGPRLHRAGIRQCSIPAASSARC